MPPPCFLSPPCQSGTWTVITPIHRAQRNHHLILLPPGRCRPSIRGLSSQTLSDSKGLHPRPVLGTDDVDTFTQGPRLLLLYRSTRCASQNPEAQLKVQPEPRSGAPPPALHGRCGPARAAPYAPGTGGVSHASRGGALRLRTVPICPRSRLRKPKISTTTPHPLHTHPCTKTEALPASNHWGPPIHSFN